MPTTIVRLITTTTNNRTTNPIKSNYLDDDNIVSNKYFVSNKWLATTVTTDTVLYKYNITQYH